MARFKKLSNEFEAIGFYLNAHPLDAYGDALTKYGVVRSSNLIQELKIKAVRPEWMLQA